MDSVVLPTRRDRLDQLLFQISNFMHVGAVAFGIIALTLDEWTVVEIEYPGTVESADATFGWRALEVTCTPGSLICNLFDGDGETDYGDCKLVDSCDDAEAAGKQVFGMILAGICLILCAVVYKALYLRRIYYIRRVLFANIVVLLSGGLVLLGDFLWQENGHDAIRDEFFSEGLIFDRSISLGSSVLYANISFIVTTLGICMGVFAVYRTHQRQKYEIIN
eukprot:TRINITY_DN1221_c0_g3_i1.p1 TRINITY_DN1221_c0_g3~~TRINITY_DN1221_c0_g3_i1.p1  ORF type:complete len:221 (-),score=40.21 TRINITY_DN1221_c0_g3_i1:140-802(-)